MARAGSVRRYARAAFEVALSHNELDRWEKDLADLGPLMADADFSALLVAPQVPLSVKLDGVRTLLRDVSPRVRNFVSVLVAHGQASGFARMAAEFARLADEKRGVARADIVTAVPVDPERRRRIADSLSAIVGQKVLMTERVDPAIVGGVVARVGDRLIDGSTRTRLQQMRSTLAVRPL